MKRIRTYLPVLLLLLCTKAEAHKEWVHQHIVSEAYKLLESQVGIIPELRDQIFNSGYVPYYGDSPDGVHNIMVGAWREDSEDRAYGYGSIFNGVTPSITHFWRADLGDYQHNDIKILGTTLKTNVENAWEKAHQYLFGGILTNIFISGTLNDGVHPLIPYDGLLLTYSKLTDLYRSGTYTVLGYYKYEYDQNISAYVYNYYGVSDAYTYINGPMARNDCYDILGRVAHLLGDMSVPAHTHLHLHPCPAGIPDYYENEMGGVWPSAYSKDCEKDIGTSHPAYSWTYRSALAQGGLVHESLCQIGEYNILHYLFYTTNQLADFFPSGINFADIVSFPLQSTGFGNSNLPNGTNDYLAARYAAFGSSPSSIDVNQIADETFTYAIRATATLFYWFAKETQLVDNSDLYLQASNVDFPVRDAAENIYIGQSVTNGYPQGAYVVNGTADAHYRARNKIHITDGFHAVAGSSVNPSTSMHMYIDQVCNLYVPYIAVVPSQQGSSAQGFSAKRVPRETPPGKQDTFAVSPNPFKDRLDISFDLSQGAGIQIDLLDISGRSVKKLLNKSFGEGTFSLSLETGSLPPGIYFCMFRGNISKTLKVVKID